MAASPISDKRIGLAHWMEQVVIQAEKAADTFDSDAVHDLRTALRRCRSIAEGLRTFDPHPAWKKMRRAGKVIFSSLGQLRDNHVMSEWVAQLAHQQESDPVAQTLSEFLATQEHEHKQVAAEALDHFDRKQWQNWAEELPARAAHLPIDGPLFAHLALERCRDAYDLHRRALRVRSQTSFHELRIGLKHFRYVVENFLPLSHAVWGEDLKNLQDLLGDVHDLDVLWQTAVRVRAFPDAHARTEWHARIVEERQERLREYKEKMTGRLSLWKVWSAGLPQPSEWRGLGFERLRIWASCLDPDFDHAEHVGNLALRLYDSLPATGIFRPAQRTKYRDVLHAAALMHDVGRSRAGRGHHKASARMVRNLTPPLGWTLSDLRLIAMTARYHRGALPAEKQRLFAMLKPPRQRLVQFLGGILRLACACDRDHDRKISRIEVESSTPVCTLHATGYSESSPLAEHLAAARHLLEVACRCPILIVPTAQSQSHAA